jgi:hypothetical protein
LGTTPHAKIKVPVTSPASLVTQNKIHTTRLKDEIKFLHMKKAKLNQQLYNIHLKAAQECGNSWYIFLDLINESINKEMTKKHETIKLKLKKLEKIQTSTPTHHKKFYPRVVNKTDVTFNADELALLNKGLKYNLSYKRNNWIETLALKAETAVSKLPVLEQDSIRYQVAHNIKLLYKQNAKGSTPNTPIKSAAL